MTLLLRLLCLFGRHTWLPRLSWMPPLRVDGWYCGDCGRERDLAEVEQ